MPAPGLAKPQIARFPAPSRFSLLLLHPPLSSSPATPLLTFGSQGGRRQQAAAPSHVHAAWAGRRVWRHNEGGGAARGQATACVSRRGRHRVGRERGGEAARREGLARAPPAGALQAQQAPLGCGPTPLSSGGAASPSPLQRRGGVGSGRVSGGTATTEHRSSLGSSAELVCCRRATQTKEASRDRKAALTTLPAHPPICQHTPSTHCSRRSSSQCPQRGPRRR